MELSWESALSPGGLVGHASYFLLVLSMTMRSMTWLRILVIASAMTAIAYDVIWLKDPIGVFWEGLLVTVTMIQISREWLSERRARFTPEEQTFVGTRLAALSKADARRTLNMGILADGEPGVVLTTEQEPVKNLVYLASGRVDIFMSDQKVGACEPGNFVGEMSVLSGSPASATAVVAVPSRYWLIGGDQIRQLQESEPAIAAAFQTGIARDLRDKIIASNEAASSAG